MDSNTKVWWTPLVERRILELMQAWLERTDVQNDLSRVVDALPGLVWTALPDGDIDFLNQRWCEYTGLGVEEARGRGWQAAVHPDDLHLLLERWPSEMAGGKRGEMEARLRRSDGEYRWFLFRTFPLLDAAGQIEKWCGINTDIEDRRRAEKDLRRSRRFLLEVQRASHTGGWRYDVASDTVESSHEIQRFYEPQPDEDIARPSFWFGRIHPEDRTRVQTEFERCLRERSEYQAGYRILLPNGNIRYQYATGHPIVDEGGSLVEFIGAAMDMTDHWLATKDLERASEALRELQATMSRAAQIATVGEFAASMAHEVNQPLSGIITNANTCLRMLAADPPNVDGARETARRTIRDGNRASDVITRLRALFSKQEFALEPLDLNEATREVIALSSSELQRNRVFVESDLAENLPPVRGDRVQIQQVILNLVRNASEAMTVIHDRRRELAIRTNLERSGSVRLVVEDVGIGIEPQNIDKLFAPFYTTKTDGMGIGLSVSRSIIESHHGRLWAQANEGPGATFSFSIPRAFEDLSRSRSMGEASAPATGGAPVMGAS